MGKGPTNRCEWLATLPEGSIGAELGVQRARFARRMLMIVKPARLYLVDAWRRQTEGNLVDRRRTDQEHEELRLRAMRVIEPFRKECDIRVLHMQTVEAATHVEDHELDWLYIDAAHTFHGVYGDLNAWYPKVRAGGWIGGHDYTPGYHGQAAGLSRIETLNRGPDDGYGVVAAVTQFLAEHGNPALHITEERSKSFLFRKEE